CRLTAQTRSCLTLSMIVSQANTLADRRRARGWSQATLAEKSGGSRTGVSAIEMGRLVPSVAAALRPAAAAGGSVRAVLGGGGGRAGPTWGWAPTSSDTRCWQASVNHRVLAYPVELTAAGSIPHDRSVPAADAAARPDRTLVIAGCDPTAGLLAYEMAERH